MFCFFGEACGILAPWPAIEPAPPALEGKAFRPGQPGKPLLQLLNEAIRPTGVTFYWSKQVVKPAQLHEEREEALPLGERSGRVTLKKACAMGDTDAGILGNCLLYLLTQFTFWPHTKYTHHHLSPWLITQP